MVLDELEVTAVERKVRVGHPVVGMTVARQVVPHGPTVPLHRAGDHAGGTLLQVLPPLPAFHHLLATVLWGKRSPGRRKKVNERTEHTLVVETQGSTRVSQTNASISTPGRRTDVRSGFQNESTLRYLISQFGLVITSSRLLFTKGKKIYSKERYTHTHTKKDRASLVGRKECIVRFSSQNSHKWSKLSGMNKDYSGKTIARNFSRINRWYHRL